MFGFDKNELRFHVISWLIFICYEILFVVTVSGQSSHVSDYVLHYMVNIGFFYFHALWIYPFIVSSKKPFKYLLFPFLLAFELVIYVFVMILVAHILHKLENKAVVFNELYLLRYIWRGLYFLIFSTAFYYVYMSSKNEKRIFQLEMEKISNILDQELLKNKVTRSENAWRQSQLNPHFLFNSLNLIFNEVNAISPESGKSIMMLSQIMRFSLSPLSSEGKISLSDEIDHIELFIKLNKLRFENKLSLNFMVSGESEELFINPLLLITLVENIFKYGDLYDELHPASIVIHIKDGILDFKTVNTIIHEPKISNGIGLKNVEERLATYYPDHYEFIYSKNNNVFTLHLLINLNSYDKVLYNR